MKMTEYKDSEIGRIPADWEVVALRDIGSFSKGNGISREDSLSGDIPAIRYGELYVNQHDYIREFTSHISPEIAKIAHPIHRGDLMFTASGETKEDIGKSIAYAGDMVAYAGGDLIILSPNRELNPIFMGYLTNAEYVRKQKEVRGQGDAVVHITSSSIGDIRIALPPLEEQNAIADLLSSSDSLISSLDEVIKKKRLIKEGMMQELLTGKKRLEGFSGKWIEKSIGELGELTGAGVDKLSIESEKPIRLVNYLDVFHRDYIYDSELNFWVTASDKKIEKCNVKKGDVFFTPSSEMPYDIAMSAVAMEDMPGVCYSYHIYRLSFNEDIDLKFKAYMFKTSAFYKQASILCEGSGKRYVISMPKFRSMVVKYPLDLDEQKAIATVLYNLDNEIMMLDTLRKKHDQIKKGMNQQLLTGKTRL